MPREGCNSALKLCLELVLVIVLRGFIKPLSALLCSLTVFSWWENRGEFGVSLTKEDNTRGQILATDTDLF